ncbi:phosphatase PAP2 family protein [Neolewinella persica]|uniref:phosphatase PAP2 family protein n=1 Tax=Neolewinella persica TaxID=70998 RepID=UPI00036ECA71|nr:phosphatase PAP2 family protein [Neolewinella persica]
MKLTFFSLLLVFTGSLQLTAQFSDTIAPAFGEEDYEIHRVNRWVSAPLVIIGSYASATRLRSLQDKPVITQIELDVLNPDDVAGIDRIALRQDFSKHKQAAIVSDYLFGAGQLAPLALFGWKKYRKDWINIGLMYLEAQATQGLFYGYAPFGPTSIDRYRPRVYYDEAEFDSRTNGQQRSSTFSGHVSTASTGFYFLAKMIDDYNPDLTGGQKVLLYSAASVPGLATAYLRVRAVKHYPTDTMIGLGVGAISGIMVPEFHRWWAKRHRTRAMVAPLYGGGAVGGSFTLHF